MNHIKIFIVLQFFWIQYTEANNASEYFKTITSFRDCLSTKHPAVCVKERALDVLNETIYSDQPMSFYGVDIERNPNFEANKTEENLPEEVSQRSLKLSDILHDKIEEFFKSRTIKFNMDSAFEGRKKGGGKKGGMMMMGMMAVGCMIGQMMMGKIAMLAGSALIIAKVALFLSAIMALKKTSGGGGGGETQHVVYASGGGDYGHSHGGGGGGGGGGWHRSIDDAQNLAYKAHILENSVGY